MFDSCSLVDLAEGFGGSRAVRGPDPMNVCCAAARTGRFDVDQSCRAARRASCNAVLRVLPDVAACAA